MTEFENMDFEFRNSEFNDIDKEFLNTGEYNSFREKVAENEEFLNGLNVNGSDEAEMKNKSNSADASSNLSSIQGDAVSKGAAASVSSSMGTAVSAIALCVASVGVSAYTDNPNQNVPQVESHYEESFEEPQIINDYVQENKQEDTENVEKPVQPEQKFQVTSADYSGEYDGQSHSGSIVNVPDGAIITYGESPDKIYLREVPQYKDAGEYTVYYKIEKQGYEPYIGSFTIKINKKTVEMPSPEVKDTIYNGKVQFPEIMSDQGYKYSGTLSATDAGTYKIKLMLDDNKNYQWSDGRDGEKTVSWVIRPREVTVDWHGEKSYAYDGQKHTIDVTLGNVAPGDFLNFTVRENSASEPGSYKAEVTSINGSENYVLPKQSSFVWTIKQIDNSQKTEKEIQ